MSMLAFTFGALEWAVIGVVALLIFGRRLPDVARSMGKSIVEFKRGLNDVKGEIDSAAGRDELPSSSPPPPPPPPQDDSK